MKPLAEQIEALLAPTINGMGFDIVQVKVIDGKNSRLLQIMAERPDGSMSLDDCTAISHQVSAIMDVEDIIPTAYRLEVGSPGIDRPLRKEAEFAKYAGHLAKVETILPVNGRKRFTGEIKSAKEGQLVLTVDKTDVPISIDDISSAKLLLTDALIKMHHKAEA